MKRIIALILLLLLTVSFAACKSISKEEREAINKAIEESNEYMTEYLEEKYPGSEITNCKQSIGGDALYGFDIYGYTEYTVKINGKEHMFFHDNNNDEVYSSVNYDLVVLELHEKMNENELIAKAASKESRITCYIIPNRHLKVLNEKHETIDDVLQYMKDNADSRVIYSIHTDLKYDIEISDEDVKKIEDYPKFVERFYIDVHRPKTEVKDKTIADTENYKSVEYILHNKNEASEGSKVVFYYTDECCERSNPIGDLSHTINDESDDRIAMLMLCDENGLKDDGMDIINLSDCEINSEYEWIARELKTPEKTSYRLIADEGDTTSACQLIIQGDNLEDLIDIAEAIVIVSWEN
jgi:hypothetical protein